MSSQVTQGTIGTVGTVGTQGTAAVAGTVSGTLFNIWGAGNEAQAGATEQDRLSTEKEEVPKTEVKSESDKKTPQESEAPHTGGTKQGLGWVIGAVLLIFLFMAVAGIYVLLILSWSKPDEDYDLTTESVNRVTEALGKNDKHSGCPATSADFAPQLFKKVGGIPVVCDTDTEGGGWIIFQRRMSGDRLFNLTYQEYRVGFGASGHFSNFWLGLNAIHHFCGAPKNCELLIDMKWSGRVKYGMKAERIGRYHAQYSSFSVADAASGYGLIVGGYTGTAGDSLSKQNGAKFSAFDGPQDVECAKERKGGFWYTTKADGCTDANPNGEIGVNGKTGLYWKSLANENSLAFIDMKLRVKS